MQRHRRAVIDVGTNSVKLLVADVDGVSVNPLIERSCQTRLGQGFYETHMLQPELIAQTAQAVATFRLLATEWQADSLKLVATSAARDASNQSALVDALDRASGVRTQVISGETEAEWVFRGVTSDSRFMGQRLLILDVGGGSTEFILGEGGHSSFQQSFSMGSVRLLERLCPADPPNQADLGSCRNWLREFFHQQIPSHLESLLRDSTRPKARLVGTGGAASILACMNGELAGFDRDRIEGMQLSLRQVAEWTDRLWSLSVAERRKIQGLPANRADVILTGAAIYEAVMEHFCFSELNVSTRGLRFGAILAGSANPL